MSHTVAPYTFKAISKFSVVHIKQLLDTSFHPVLSADSHQQFALRGPAQASYLFTASLLSLLSSRMLLLRTLWGRRIASLVPPKQLTPLPNGKLEGFLVRLYCQSFKL